MRRRLTGKEVDMLKDIHLSDYPHCKIEYVYFIYSWRRLLYIGKSRRPNKRMSLHVCDLAKDQPNLRVVVFGPFEAGRAAAIEAAEISKRKSTSLLNKNLYDTNKKGRSKKEKRSRQGESGFGLLNRQGTKGNKRKVRKRYACYSYGSTYKMWVTL